MAALLALAAPLMANRLVLNLLQSTETIMIPERLTVYGLTRSQAVRTYGTLTGMAMPFVLFPSALVNSLAVVLLPVTARHQSAGNDSGIADGISMAFRYSLYLGIFCVGVFTVFGEALGLQIFKSQDAGSFIQILAWLCPFLYLATSSGSILNGLGKTKLTFFHHLISLLVRITFVWFGIPVFGIRSCLWGMLASEVLLALLHILALRRITAFEWNAWILIGKPGINVSTKFVYGNLHLDEVTEHPDIDGMVQAIRNHDLYGITDRMGNVLESVTCPAYPVIDEIKAQMMKNGAVNAMMSGSGPTVFGIFDDPDKAEFARDQLKISGLSKQTFLTTVSKPGGTKYGKK